jgi:hypothetical protein
MVAQGSAKSGKTTGKRPKKRPKTQHLAPADRLAVSGLARLPWCGYAGDAEPAVSALAETFRPPDRPLLPVQTVVDRTVPPDVFYIDEKFPELILRQEYGAPAGRLPGDPAHFPPDLDSRSAVCHVLSPVAAMRCLGNRFYF